MLIYLVAYFSSTAVRAADHFWPTSFEDFKNGKRENCKISSHGNRGSMYASGVTHYDADNFYPLYSNRNEDNYWTIKNTVRGFKFINNGRKHILCGISSIIPVNC